MVNFKLTPIDDELELEDPQQQTAGVPEFKPNLSVTPVEMAPAPKDVEAIQPKKAKLGTFEDSYTSSPEIPKQTKIEAIPLKGPDPELQLSQAPDPTWKEKIRAPFRKASWDDMRARASNTRAMAELFNVPVTDVDKNYDKFVKATGLKDQPDVEQLMTLPVIAGMMVAPFVAPAIKKGATAGSVLMGMAKNMAKFLVLGEVENSIATLVRGERYKFGQYSRPSQWLPEEVGQQGKALFDIVDTLAKIGLTRVDATSKIKQKFFRGVTEEYNLPKTIRISPAEVRDSFSLNPKLIKPEDLDLLKTTLAGSKGAWADAAKKGIEIKVPLEKVVRMADKPFWKNLKGVLNMKPGEEYTLTHAMGKQSTGPYISGLLDSPVKGIPKMTSTQDAVAFSRVATPAQIKEVISLGKKYEGEAQAIRDRAKDILKAGDTAKFENLMDKATEKAFDAQLMHEVVQAKDDPARFDIDQTPETTPPPGFEETLENMGATKLSVSDARHAIKTPDTTTSIAMADKRNTKSVITEGIKKGEIDGAVRFTTADELNTILSEKRVPISEEYGQIHAQPVLGRDDDAFVAYGSYDKRNVAIVFPKEAVQQKVDAHTKEVIIDPNVNVEDLRFVIGGDPKLYAFDEIADPTPAPITPHTNILPSETVVDSELPVGMTRPKFPTVSREPKAEFVGYTTIADGSTIPVFVMDGSNKAVTEGRLGELNIAVPDTPPPPDPDRDIKTQEGKPFKSEEQLEKELKRRGLEDYEIVKTRAGYVGRTVLAMDDPVTKRGMEWDKKVSNSIHAKPDNPFGDGNSGFILRSGGIAGGKIAAHAQILRDSGIIKETETNTHTFSRESGAIRYTTTNKMLGVSMFSKPTPEQLAVIASTAGKFEDVYIDMYGAENASIKNVVNSSLTGKKASNLGVLKSTLDAMTKKVKLSTGGRYIGDAGKRAISSISPVQQKRILKLLVEIPKWMKEAGADAELMDRVDVELKSIVEIPSVGAEKSIQQHVDAGRMMEKILGATTFDPTGLFAVMQLSLDQGTGTLHKTTIHETYHVLKEWTLPKTESTRLSRYYNNNEEVEADDFANFILNEKDDKRPSWVSKIYKRIRDLLEKVWNWAKGNGFTSSADTKAIWESLRQGAWNTRPIPTPGARTTTAFKGEPKPTTDWYYSAAKKVVDDPQIPTKAQSVVNWMQKKGVKPAELKWLGVEEWINSNKTPQGKIDRDALREWVNSNELIVEEHLKKDGGVELKDALEPLDIDSAVALSDNIVVAIYEINPALQRFEEAGFINSDHVNELLNDMTNMLVEGNSIEDSTSHFIIELEHELEAFNEMASRLGPDVAMNRFGIRLPSEEANTMVRDVRTTVIAHPPTNMLPTDPRQQPQSFMELANEIIESIHAANPMLRRMQEYNLIDPDEGLLNTVTVSLAEDFSVQDAINHVAREINGSIASFYGDYRAAGLENILDGEEGVVDEMFHYAEGVIERQGIANPDVLPADFRQQPQGQQFQISHDDALNAVNSAYTLVNTLNPVMSELNDIGIDLHIDELKDEMTNIIEIGDSSLSSVIEDMILDIESSIREYRVDTTSRELRQHLILDLDYNAEIADSIIQRINRVVTRGLSRPPEEAILEMEPHPSVDLTNGLYEPTVHGEYIRPFSKADDYTEIILTAPDTSIMDYYMSSHWQGIKNPFSHIRFDSRVDTDNNSVMLLQEVQSDWAKLVNEGDEIKKEYLAKHLEIVQDFEEKRIPYSVKVQRQRSLAEEYKEKHNLNPNALNMSHVLSKDEFRLFKEYEDRVNSSPGVDTISLRNEYRDKFKEKFGINTFNLLLRGNAIAPMPFAENWHEPTMKRALRYAAEKGYDRLGWTTGAHQIARWSDSLRQVVDNIEWEKVISPHVPPSSIRLKGFKGGYSKFNEVIPIEGTAKVAGREVTLRGLIGDSIYSKIKSGIDTGESSGSIRGSDLTIGGQGFTNLYDQLLPGFLKKYGKQWNAKVGMTEVNLTRDLDGDKTNIHYIDITDEMRDSVLHKGQTLFSVDNTVKTDNPSKVKQRVMKMKDEYLKPVEGSALDKSAIAYLKESDPDNLQSYFDNMPTIGDMLPNEVYRFDEKAQKYISTITTSAGKIKPAIRQSGYHVLDKWKDEVSGFQDISKRVEKLTDPTRMMQTMDQGYFGGPVQQQILWPARSNTLAKLKWVDRQKVLISKVIEKYNIDTKVKDEAVIDVLEHVTQSKAFGGRVDDILNMKNVQEVLSGIKAKDHKNIVNAALESRILFTRMRARMNKARKLRKQPEIPARKMYVPDIRNDTMWSRAYGLFNDKHTVMERPEMPDFIQPNKPFNPRELVKEGSIPDYLKEKRMSMLLADYADTAGKDIFDTNTIHNNKIYSAVMKSVGLENSASAIDTWTSEVFANVSPSLTKFTKQVVPEFVYKSAMAIRRNLTRAVFPLNFTWNAFIQTSSAGLTFARYGAAASVYGLSYVLDPAMFRAVRNNAYSSILKSRWGGKTHYQDVQDSIVKNRRLQSSKLDSALEYSNYLTSAIEDALTGHAIAAAYYHGKNVLNLDGRELWEYASEGGSKTQSMYNYGDIPGLLRAKEIGAAFPFQTFGFEIFNTVREINVPVLSSVIGRVGTYQTTTAAGPKKLKAPDPEPSITPPVDGTAIALPETMPQPEGDYVDPNSEKGKATLRKRVAMLLRWTAAIMVTNAVADRAIGRKPWTISSFIPFAGYMFGGIPHVGPVLGGSYSGKGPTPHEYIGDFTVGVRHFMVYDDFTKLRQWMLRYHVIAGVQVDRTLQGIEAVIREEVKDVRGHTLFEVDRSSPSEVARSIGMGPYRTKAGMEYLKGRDDDKKGLTKKGAKQTIKRGEY